MIDRRTFIQGSIAAGACCWLGTGDADAEDAPKLEPGVKDLGPVSDYAAGSVVDTHARTHAVIVSHFDERIWILSAICSHQKCRVFAKKLDLECPCHGSKFTESGTPTNGPARWPLYRHKVWISDDGRLMTDTRVEFDEEQWEDEGAFVTVEAKEDDEQAPADE